MKAEKSLSSWLSRKNISVAGRADHSVMAFILMVVACSSVSLAGSKVSQGISFAIFQRDFSRSRNRSGYNIGSEGALEFMAVSNQCGSAWENCALKTTSLLCAGALVGRRHVQARDRIDS